MKYRIIFDGVSYKIYEDDNAVVVFLEGQPVWGACILHGNHKLLEIECPYLEELIKKVNV
jgi:hypothetical protein